MIKKYKNYLLGAIGILLVLTMLVGVKYLMKPKYEELPEVKLVKLKDIKSKKSFAIMVQNGDGYEEYTSTDNTWPGAEYVYKEAKCVDNNGALVEDAITFASETKTVTLETDKTVSCTLYFDEKPKTIEYLRTKDTQGYLSEELQGGMYRYQASFEEGDSSEMTNWICFGTTENCGTDETDSDSNNIPDGIDKYMYRIIGITEEGEMYLIKETFLKKGKTNTFKWHNTNSISNCLGDKCEWSNVDLYKRLNGETSNGDPIFVDSSEYEYMTKDGDWYNLIADHDWMYGDTKEPKYNGDEMYAIETGKTATKRYWPDEGQETCSSDNQCTEKDYTWSKSTDATKIGLMYMHDIDYAYTDGNPRSSTNIKNSWIHFQKDGYNTTQDYEWLTTRFGVGSASSTVVNAWYVNDSGSRSGSTLNDARGARPVFYLESKAKIASGDGTKDSPFILA